MREECVIRKLTAVLILLLCLPLSSCGQKTALTGSVLGQAAGLEENETLLVIDGREIPAWQYLYWLAAACRELENRCEAAGAPLDWFTPLPGGGTLEDLVKADALADTALYAAVNVWSEAYGCTLTEKELEDLPKRSYPGLSEAQGQVLTAAGKEYAKLYALYETPGSPLFPAEGELELFQENLGTADTQQILIPISGDRDAARQRAAALFAQLNAAEDQASAFSALSAENGGGTLGETAQDKALLDAAAALKPGQISGILETAAGFSILRRPVLTPEALREAYFDTLLQDAAAASEIQFKSAYISLRPADFWAAAGRAKSITSK